VQFAFTEEQETLRREARDFLARTADPSWAQLAELGWLGVSVPEEQGGAGLGFLEEAVLFEELGRSLYAGPYFATVGLALPALGPLELEGVAAGEERWSAEVDGLVPDLASVDRVVVAGGSVPAAGEELPTVDETRPLGRLSGSGDPDPLAGVLDRSRTLAALALEAVGIAQHVLALGVGYVSGRQQFGRPIGIYQAVSHALADTYVETELARSLGYWSAWCVAEGDAQAPLAAAAAKAFASETAVAACERSIQVHGGIGFTWEHELHRYYKRAQWIEAFWGFPTALRAEVAAAILEPAAERTEDGIRYASLDDLGSGGGFRKVRRELGVDAFGVNGVVYPPGQEGFPHYHDEQDELYFVHRGTARFEIEGEKFDLGPGGLVHVEAATVRKISNPGDEELVLLVVGGKGGYVGRDGRLVNPEDLARRQAFGRGSGSS
jgi:alkylation response protein AidB-like acyl-CoA dehydrogenase/quercetin dioxygenase-like cupin family protein